MLLLLFRRQAGAGWCGRGGLVRDQRRRADGGWWVRVLVRRQRRGRAVTVSFAAVAVDSLAVVVRRVVVVVG
ncbi:UNVERIFIED_CONTAM: hypothetical protein Sangu_2161600 [Sesamum angustifolium]|uniref:Uncharacterized protein n=1 Tax=Sesamum angustifolium TaxID=2727405 RepID=A0AAW2LFH9_9LAMI